MRTHTAMGTRTAVCWWLGWHPLATTGVGVVAGVVVGNVLVTWSVRAAMLGGGVSEYVGTTLRPVVGEGAGYLVALAFVPVLGAVISGLFVGVVLWLLGVRIVNRRAEAVVEDAIGRTGGGQRAGHEDTYVLTAGHGSRLLVEPLRRYVVSRFRFEEVALVVEQYRLRTDDRRTDHLGELRLAYERIESVAFDGSALIVTADDGRHSFATVDAPTELERELRSRCTPFRSDVTGES